MSDPSTSRPSAPRPPRGRVRRRLTAEEARQRRRRLFNWALSVSLGIVLVNALVGETGYLARVRVERDEDILRAEYYRLHLENARLKEERLRLETDPAALDEAARALGLIREGETVVTITEVTPAPHTPVESPR